MPKNAASDAAWHAATDHMAPGCALQEPNPLRPYVHFARQIDGLPSQHQPEEGHRIPYSFAASSRSQLDYASANEHHSADEDSPLGLSELKAICEKASTTSTREAQTPTNSASEARAWREFCLLTLQWACTNSTVAESEQLTQQPEEMRDSGSPQVPGDVTPDAASLPVFRPPPGLEDGPWPQRQTTQESFLAAEYGFVGIDSGADTSPKHETVDALESGDTTPKHERSTSQKPSADSEMGETLRKHLQELQHEDPHLVIIVRRISKLGFQSPELLRHYFEEYGDISKILVAHSFVKPSNRRVKPRVRPAGLGFVVMSSRADADAVLCLGENQTIAGVPVQVQLYAQPQQAS